MKKYALLFIMALTFASAFVFIKLAIKSYNPVMIAVSRSLISALSLGVLATFGNIKQARHVLKRKRFHLVCSVSGLGYAYYWTVIPHAEHGISSALTSMLTLSIPIFTYILALLIFRSKKFSWLNFVGVVVACFGVVWLLGFKKLAVGHVDVFSVLLALSGFIVFALVFIVNGRYQCACNPVVNITITLTYCTLILLIYGLISAKINMASVGQGHMEILLALGIASTAVPFGILFYLTQTEGSLFVSYYGYLMPILGVLLGIVVFSEPVYWHQCFGIMTALVGVALVQKKVKAEVN